MLRARFYVNKKECEGDYRPVTWPIRYPYWCTGESEERFILVAYAESEDEIRSLWPEVEEFDFEEEVEEITFSSRFPKPDWYCPCRESSAQQPCSTKKEGGEE